MVVFQQQAEAKASYYSYETQTNTIDDGNKVLTRVEERKSDSTLPDQQSIRQRLILGPSKLRLMHNNWINRHQLRTNNIGIGLPRAPIEASGSFEKVFNKYTAPINNNNPFEPAASAINLNLKRGRGFLSRARTVESPALSVDSGGQASSGLAHEITAKLLDVKQGHYADIYNKIDRVNSSPVATRKPAEAIEDALKWRFSGAHI